jgi:PAS domain S-box-containing protein
MIVTFVQNATLLITLSVLYGLLKWYKPSKEFYFQFISGLWFGFVAIAAMMMPFRYDSGIIYDGRSVVITLAGLWGGGYTTLISAGIAIIYRIYLGGAGVYAGVATLLFCGLTGLLFRTFLINRLNKLNVYVFWGIGFVSHLVMLASQLLIPNQPLQILKIIWLPVLLVFPLAFALIAMLFRIIDEYIRSSQKIREAEEWYRTTLLSIGDAVICTNQEGRINQMNKVAEEITGWKLHEAKGKKLEVIFNIINEETRIKVESPFEKVIKTGAIVDLANHTLLISKNGTEIPIADSGAPIKNGNEIIGIVIVFRDQTHERIQQKKLLESEQAYRKLFENHTAIKLLVDADSGNIVKANQAASEYYGWSIDKLETMHIREINILSDEKIYEAMEDVRLHKQDYFEFKHRLANGQIRDVEVFKSQTEYKGKILLHSIIHDVTEKKQFYDELIAAKEKAEESERLKSAFLANMSHEIRTPLNGILGFTNLLAEDENLTKETKHEFAQIIKKSADGLLKIINDILDISRLETGRTILEQKTFDVDKMLSTVNAIFQKKISDSENKHVILQMVNANNAVLMISDENKLIQIFSNLLDNAIRFTSSGKIEFGISEVSENGIEFFVSDTGIGIPAEKHHMVFDRFMQADPGISRSYGGTGLGLAIVKKLVELMGGKIYIASEPGKGTRFWFRLPYDFSQGDASRIEKFDSERIKAVLPYIDTMTKILIVEDDLNSRFILQKILDKRYKCLFFANTGKQALQLFETETPDIILMDIGLPDINGLDIVKQIRANGGKKIRIIAQTAYAQVDDKRKAIEAGCDDFISKPIKAECC